MSGFNIYFIAQNGRLEFEALLLVLSLRKCSDLKDVKVFACTPINSDLWKTDPDMRNSRIGGILKDLDVQVVPFENERFGISYPHSNKMYALSALPSDEPFVFFDTDHVFFGDVTQTNADFSAPTARFAAKSWPRGQGSARRRAEIWNALYAKFGLDTDGWYRAECDVNDAMHYPYFNGGCFFHDNAGQFFELYRRFMHDLHQAPPKELQGLSLFPNLDQICLPLVLNAVGGKSTLLRGDFCFAQVGSHYFELPKLFQSYNAEALKVAREVIQDDGYADVFMQNSQFKGCFGDAGYATALKIQKAAASNKDMLQDLNEALPEHGYISKKPQLAAKIGQQN